ncbi:toluene tolerance protein [Pseudomonas sp. sp1636]|uniref:toluene tolerance protein n=1 Tax=Pseudomonas sp. sp1636 TaxID=3036707 RepID=UPI0025A5D22A|nr:toluene tolerance protein [Pseudomonas sp. sp1636]MDM8348430.1 toluene tolerance protein [Pseudomonas sp. sp1636]
MTLSHHISSISSQQLEALGRGGQVLEQDSHGPKVIRQSNGRMLKIFYPRKGLSLSRLFPTALRFARNAERLRALSIPSLQVEQVYRADNRVFAALYQPIPGVTLRQKLDTDKRPTEPEQIRLAHFINQLHRKGVYFRSLHLGNIVECPDGQFGLIDIADMRFFRLPLNRWQISRNRAHFEKYVEKEGLPFPCQALWALCEKLR